MPESAARSTPSAASLRGHRAPAGEGDRLRIELLDAAEQQLATEGAGGLSLRQVARACDVSPTSVYLHFANKEALVIGVCNRRFGKLVERMRAARGRCDSTLERIVAMGEAYLQFALENPELYTAYFGAIPLEDVLEQLPIEEIAGFGALAELTDLIAQGMDEGVIRRENPDLVANAMWGAVHGAASVIHFTRPVATSSVGENVRAILDLILQGILARPADES